MIENPAITPLCPSLKCKSKKGCDLYDNNGKKFAVCSECGTIVPIRSGIKSGGNKLNFKQWNKLFGQHGVSKKRQILFLCLAVIASGYFRTGCLRNAEAANLMLTKSYSFTTIQDVVVTEAVPPNGATGVARTQLVSVSFTHPLPVVSATVTVKADGAVWAGTQVMTSITGGKKIVWSPTEPFPMYSNITWELNVTVNNGL